MAAREPPVDDTKKAGGPRIGGRAVYYDPPRPPKTLEEEGKDLADRAAQALEQRPVKNAETDLRAAIERFVDAFLLDRGGHTSAFAIAHQIGAFVSRRFGCPLKSDDSESWYSECGIWALHARMGLSIGGVTRGHCSICSADDLGCAHIPGGTYEGGQCVRVVHKVDLEEVSVVPFPDDPRCYRLELFRTSDEIEELSGEARQPGAVPVCTHCEACPGIPTAEDIDQNLWEPARRR